MMFNYGVSSRYILYSVSPWEEYVNTLQGDPLLAQRILLFLAETNKSASVSGPSQCSSQPLSQRHSNDVQPAPAQNGLQAEEMFSAISSKHMVFSG